jgi:hypothetical protein
MSNFSYPQSYRSLYAYGLPRATARYLRKGFRPEAYWCPETYDDDVHYYCSSHLCTPIVTCRCNGNSDDTMITQRPCCDYYGY